MMRTQVEKDKENKKKIKGKNQEKKLLLVAISQAFPIKMGLAMEHKVSGEFWQIFTTSCQPNIKPVN